MSLASLESSDFAQMTLKLPEKSGTSLRMTADNPCMIFRLSTVCHFALIESFSKY